MTAESVTPHPASTEVRHEPALSRYTLWQDGANVGLADYQADGRKVVFTHTEVDPALRGRGLAGILVQRALDDVRTRTDRRVVARCPYVRFWIDRHPDYQDLLTRGN